MSGSAAPPSRRRLPAPARRAAPPNSGLSRPARRAALPSRGLPGPARRAAWFAILAAVVGLLLVASVDRGGAETDAERIQRLTESFACPECAGQSVAESNAPVAANIREVIAEEVTAGRSDTEIRDLLVAGYGGRVLRNPPAEGVASLVWVLPVVLLVAGAAGLATMMARSGSGSALTVNDADRELVARARRSSGPDAETDEGL